LTQQLSGMWNEVKKSVTSPDAEASNARDDRLKKAVSDLTADCKAGDFPAALSIAKQEMTALGHEYYR
jgi:outer membrane murein-binding lipoprotein Lpp